MTYVPTEEGWLDPATVIDIASRRVIGWATADHLRTDLVADALTAACRQRRPTRPGDLSLGPWQYTSQQFATLATEFGVHLSVGRTGQCSTTRSPSRSSSPSNGSCSTRTPGPAGPPPAPRRRVHAGSRVRVRSRIPGQSPRNHRAGQHQHARKAARRHRNTPLKPRNPAKPRQPPSPDHTPRTRLPENLCRSATWAAHSLSAAPLALLRLDLACDLSRAAARRVDGTSTQEDRTWTIAPRVTGISTAPSCVPGAARTPRTSLPQRSKVAPCRRRPKRR
ncbi:DDE-type integrase/transposase/recombinase [Streptomyces yerevanensis]|uniref:DDE-type integrase/transposase/recombinase n=1 Tax=Streptomyces yerevanensis TaxID=66378 RepID=UPI003CCBD4B3